MRSVHCSGHTVVLLKTRQRIMFLQATQMATNDNYDILDVLIRRFIFLYVLFTIYTNENNCNSLW